MLKMKVNIKCENGETVELKRGIDNEFGITDGFDESKKFALRQYHPDATEVKCLECGYEEPLNI